MLVAGYTALSMPYMYRAIDTGLRAIDVQTLTEAAQSLGAGWGTILFRGHFPEYPCFDPERRFPEFRHCHG